ncbi:MAG: glycoside hydrolase family 2 TIM barrel-domain containing protein [Flavobacteriales bacterium]|nr:glycoside hydrolase family 2 TIM barrel-domain containing protein [Flavobacteriales bacterium]
MQRRVALLIFLLYLANVSLGQHSVYKRQLTENWRFQEKGGADWLAAKVPGCVHTDLIENDIIEDPFYRLNESKVQWVDKKDWVYLNQFQISKKEFERTNHELQFEGLDTYAKVYLNDSLILHSNNMHRTYTVDVKKFLKKGTNYLKVVLESPIKKGIELYDALDYKIPVSANDQAETGNVPEGKRVSVFTRKAGYHYGWDWGPRLVTSGIWRPVTLVSWNKFRIKDIDVNYSYTNSVHVRANITVESSMKQSSGNLELTINDTTVASIKKIKLKAGSQKIMAEFTIEKPKLWWPKGMGDQHLYVLKAKLKSDELNDSVCYNLGIRSIELISDSNFYFKVNDRTVFIKGVNYIPQDVFLARVDNNDYKRVLMAAADANMNMVRVWGGGVYENNRFYELCDSLGLMVWQDFMFACAMYPGDDSFLENVRLEAENNYQRLKKHPSIALWCGNNENLSAWKRWGWEKTAIKEQSLETAERIWKSYDTLFHHILPTVIHQHNPLENYWSSSPSASQGVPESYDSGDTHYWGVWWGKEPFENFNTKTSKFMSEYGFQSFPEYSSFKKFAEPKDEGVYSDVMKHHQRSSIGNATIEEYMNREFNIPEKFNSLLYVSQVLQADGIRLGIESHRRNKKCMGSIYWQLNDCWPGASWSSIDYYGKWKALHYSVKKAFKPVIISHEFIDSNLRVTVVSDRKTVFVGEVEIVLSKFEGDSIIEKWTKKVEINSNESNLVLALDKSQLPKGVDKKTCYLNLILKEKNQTVSTKNVYFLPMKALKIPCPKLTTQITIDEKKNNIVVKIKSENFAKSVHVVSSGSDNFSDNFFDLPINGEKTITMGITKTDDVSTLISSIKLFSLWNTLGK